MIQLRPAAERGHSKIDWLDSWHSFSFSDYYDPDHMNFGHLRVINEDWVEPGQGFATHGHRDMEIITYVVEGELEHKDSLGNGGIIKPGDVQRMTAGTGVRHSEFNPSRSDRVHLLQIWITPEKPGLEPGYEQRSILDAGKKGQWQLIASRDGRDGSVTVHQDVSIQQAFLGAGDSLSYPLDAQRQAWIQMVCGTIELNGEASLSAGDAAAITSGQIRLIAPEPTELLLFDVAKS